MSTTILSLFHLYVGPSDDVVEQIVCKENDISENG